jgi:hypothetical protein
MQAAVEADGARGGWLQAAVEADGGGAVDASSCRS